MTLTLTPKQREFMHASASEVLFGGAAGGGKSFGQLADALCYALKYPRSKQLILRRTYNELEKSLIRAALSLYPDRIYRYNAGNHVGRFRNGSLLDFGYCASENDVFQYQSAEYDVIRFDELTHFTEFQYIYLLSRLRGVNGYPKAVKSSTNPGGIGHTWVKERFIDPAPPGEVFFAREGSRVFIPARISDNQFLQRGDPDYERRLLALPPMQRRALLEGDWNIFEGQYFSEFRTDIHTVEPFPIPKDWRRFRTIDYGLDRLACLWIALDPTGGAWVYKELCESDLIISEACRKIRERNGEDEIYKTLAPPDLWSRSQETGKSKAALFEENGVRLTRTGNDRETGWLSIKELLKIRADGNAGLRFFRNCTEILRCLPMLQMDPAKPSDTLTEPHAITHAPDALRGFAITYASPTPKPEAGPLWFPYEDLWQDWQRATPEERTYLEQKYRKERT